MPGGDAAKQANGTTGIAGIVLGAADPAPVIERYARLRQSGAPEIDIRRADRDGLMGVRFHA